jgi:GNAT superfamily N-acetyltransferase
VYRSVVIVHRDLVEPPPVLGSSLPIEIRLLEARDADAWRRHRTDLEASRVDERLARLGRGHACVAAWLDGEIVASVWLALDEARIPEIDRLLRLGPGEVFAYDSYTSESVRRHGIATARAAWTTRYLRDAGYGVVVGHLTPENRPGRGPPARAGYRELGTAGYVRLGPWRRDFVRPVGSRRRWSSERGAPIQIVPDFGNPTAGHGAP